MAEITLKYIFLKELSQTPHQAHLMGNKREKKKKKKSKPKPKTKPEKNPDNKTTTNKPPTPKTFRHYQNEPHIFSN